MPIAQEYFFKDVIHYMTEECTWVDNDDSIYFTFRIYLCAVLVWVCIFLCVF